VRHADRIPPREAARIVSDLQAFPTWALEVALVCRAHESMIEEAAEKLNVADYLDLILDHCNHHWPANDGPSVLKQKTNREGDLV
jgi:hypothetical protein